MSRWLGLAAIVLAAPRPGSAQYPVPIARDGFAVLTTFYEYDRERPLEARLVQADSLLAGQRQKLVFRSPRKP